MIKVRDLLNKKGTQVWTIKPEDTVLAALALMAEKDIGALLVMDQGKLKGIVSERDFVPSIAQTEKCLIDAEISRYMTKVVITVEPDKSLDDCMQLMTDHHIRHLPVVENSQIIGLISIGDVVKAVISAKESTIHNLEDYIEGRGFGR